eukprot:6147704-Amphidinium_carterae.2
MAEAMPPTEAGGDACTLCSIHLSHCCDGIAWLGLGALVPDSVHIDVAGSDDHGICCPLLAFIFIFL